MEKSSLISVDSQPPATVRFTHPGDNDHSIRGCPVAFFYSTGSESILPTDCHNIVVELPQRIRRGPLRPLKRHEGGGTRGELISQFRPSLVRDVLSAHMRISNNVAREDFSRMDICQSQRET